MKILALEKELPGASGEDFEPHLKKEAAKVWELYQAGVIREIHFRADRPEAVLILECDGPDQAGQVLAGLPLVKAGLIEFELIPLRPYPGLARLFGDGVGRGS